MPTLKELQRENVKLKAEREVHKDFMEADKERSKLIKENRRLRHPKLISFGSALKKGGLKTASKIKKKIAEEQRKASIQARKQMKKGSKKKKINYGVKDLI